jgi:hypothetical protein
LAAASEGAAGGLSDRRVDEGGRMKARPNHGEYLKILRRMSPEERLRKAFDLSDFSRALFLQGLRKRFPSLNETELRRLAHERLEKCHNRSS